MSIESVMPSNHLILCHPLLLRSIFPSIRVFSNESVFHIQWPKYWSFSFSISPSNEYSGLISFRTYWFDLLTAQGTLKSSLRPQFKSINSSVLSLLYGTKVSHPYMTTGKTIVLTVWSLSAKSSLCLLYYLGLSYFSSKEQVSFTFVASVTVHSDFGAQENKICHCFYFFPIYLPWSDGTRCHDLSCSQMQEWPQ